MAFTNYTNTSPYYNTPQTSWYLSTWEGKKFPALDTDVPYTVEKKYEKRPDLLSYALYGTTRLWWVFSVRNPNAIKDPIYDMLEGKEIMITCRESLFEILNA